MNHGPPPEVKTYKKHFIPMESDPEAFTKLAHALGVSASLEFVDAFVEDGKIVIFTEDKPVQALLLIFPTNEIYEKEKAEDERTRQVYTASGANEPVVWFKQTINNACGLYAILHSVVNGPVSHSIGTLFPLSSGSP
jgi:ubiquitin carboxyl-terminal hydrolase L3